MITVPASTPDRPSFDSKATARLFVSACLDGRAALPQDAVAVDQATAGVTNTKELANGRYYRLVPKRPIFLRIADKVDGGEIDHFCELRTPRLNLDDAWPIVSASVDRRIDANATANTDYYVIDYPAMRFRVKLHSQFLLMERYTDQGALKQQKKLPLPSDPNVTRSDLPY